MEIGYDDQAIAEVMPHNSSRGGRRAGAGRPPTARPLTHIVLRHEARQQLAILTLARRAARNDSRLSQRAVVEELIQAAWIEYDTAIQAAEAEISDEMIL